MKFSTMLKSAAFGALALHSIKTLHGKRIEPYKSVEAPAELNKPVKFRPKQNPIGFTNMVFSGEYMNHAEFRFDYQFTTAPELLIYSTPELTDWLKRKILSDKDYKNKHIKVKKLDKRTITFIFTEQEWFKDTLKGTRVHLSYLKNTVIIPFKILLPDLVMTRYSRPFLGTFLSKHLHQYFKRNRSAMKFQSFFKFLSTISPDMFDYSVDWFHNAFRMTVKNTVILGALAAAFGIKRRLKA